MITVKIEYLGGYAARTGVKTEELSVNENIEDAYRDLIKYLKEKHDIQPPFVLMHGNMHIIGAVKSNIPVKPGDVFKILPFLSGG